MIAVQINLKLQDFLFPGGKNNFFTGFIPYLVHAQWNEDLFIHDVTAFNRLIMVVYPRAAFIFSRRATIGISISVYILGLFVAWLANYYLSCCSFYLYYGSFSYTFLDTDYNVANIFVNTPINFVTSSFAIINYTIVGSHHRNLSLKYLASDLHFHTYVQQTNEPYSD